MKATMILSREDLAEKLECSTRTIDRYVKQGRITPIAHPLGRAPGRRVWFSWRQVRKQLGIK